MAAGSDRSQETAQGLSKETDGQLSRLKGQLELRARTLSQREVELDGLIRSRERTVRELEKHLRAAPSMLARKDVTLDGETSHCTVQIKKVRAHAFEQAQLA